MGEPFPAGREQYAGQTPEQAPSPAQPHDTELMQRHGRGRLGGSGAILAFIQRARFHGRRIKPMEGDLKSPTLASYYPSQTPDRQPILDGASMPRSDSFGDFKSWIGDAMDDMAEDGISRALDVSGGDRAMQELLADLSLAAFCEERDFKFLALCMLGSDMEDFNHIRAAVDAGVLHPKHMILMMNEGAIRSGQSPAGAFDAIMEHPDFQAMTGSGAVPFYLTRLPCMDALREQRLNFYDVAKRVAWISSCIAKHFQAISMACRRCRRDVDDKTSQLGGKIAGIDTICTNLGSKRVFNVA